ncbi:hypothetical protein [Paraburkholderia sp. J12]|uniref:hypothetical protein n=1 Tax=Paraburkholderia sp. J12 TaxID=2805432 RepID=UPI002ABDC8E9|nr:hypothetical protein [Paraburkholderia sp. J12]
MKQRIAHDLAALAPAAVLLLCGGAYAQTVPTVPASAVQPAVERVASAATYIVGEQWTFHYENALEPAKNATYTQTVSRIDGDRAELNRGASVLDANGNLVKIGDASYEPSDGKLRFPMRVGDKWTSSYTYHTGSWESIGQRQTSVVGFEGVDTAAGHFDAYKIEQVVAWRAGGGGRGEGSTRETDWYAPAVGRIVKADFVDQATHAAPTTTHVELVRFSCPQ